MAKKQKKVLSVNKAIDSNVRENIFFRYCSKEWYPIILNNQKTINVVKDDNIFIAGEPVKGIYIINTGKVKVISTYEGGKEQILRLASDGKILGYRGIAAKLYTVSSVALTDSVLTFIPYDIFITLIKTNPSFSLFIIDFMAEELRRLEERMKNMVQLEVKERIACIILTLIDSFGYDINEPGKLSYSLSRKDFSSIAGTTYETVVRSLIHLHKMKLIRLDGKEIYIPNEKKLKEFVFLGNKFIHD